MHRVLVAAIVWLTPVAAGGEPPRLEACAAPVVQDLCHSIIVPAPVADVWALWTTSDGLSSWAAPVAAIDARVGGVFESSYDPDARIGDPANIRNRVLAVTPQRLLRMHIAQTPPGFPHPQLARELATTIEFEPVGAERTLVRVTMTGYRAEPGFDELRAFFDRGNAFTLDKLYERIASGAVDARGRR